MQILLLPKAVVVQDGVETTDVKNVNLLESGIYDSSVVWNLHFNTPTSCPTGKGLSGFFKRITEDAVNNFLSILGCV